MKVIRVDTEHQMDLEHALASCNGGANAYVFAVPDLIALRDVAEEHLTRLILKKDALGARVEAMSSQPVANAYRHKRVGNQATLERKKSGWYLVELRQCNLQVWQGGSVELHLTPAQDKAAIRRLRKSYCIQTGAIPAGPGASADPH